ncbi:hypothetical protein O181_020016 [Austropuccinia psidii MF-1]|uniref:Uncharacterized protein n=1 Tax=Austropuccinia psidii MF-1 TaxID=1389203 RepID=A0A9Q3C8B4_9BASI|nr:hypothetical protein [Austropuccinia psidii MF-1]
MIQSARWLKEPNAGLAVFLRYGVRVATVGTPPSHYNLDPFSVYQAGEYSRTIHPLATLHRPSWFRNHIRTLLSEKTTSISFTTDCWISPNVTAYMAVTGHYLDQEFRLTPLLLGLTKIEGDHFGSSLAKNFLNVLNQYNLEDNINCITINNVSRNTGNAHEIKIHTMTFSAATHSIGCVAHVLHLVAHEGLKALSNGSIATSEKENEIATPMAIANLVDIPNGFNLRYDSIISHVARLASYLQQSPQSHKKFATTLKLVYDGSNFPSVTILLLHVCTQWNSAYDMLQRALLLKDAYNQF